MQQTINVIFKYLSFMISDDVYSAAHINSDNGME